jgi:hypothetical protein
MPQLTAPAGFETKYGDFRFSPYVQTVGFSAKPETNAAGWTTAFVRFSIRLRDVIEVTGDGGEAEAARQQLQAQGEAFVYKGRATGDLQVNVSPTGPMDIKFGPVTQLVEFARTPAAPSAESAKVCIVITWQVDFVLPDCECATYFGNPVELTSRVEIRPRMNGRIDRRTSGRLVIPNNRERPGSRTLLDSPDNYRYLVMPHLPRRFRRVIEWWNLDVSRTVLEFSWLDWEESAENLSLPPGCVDGDVSMDVQSQTAALVTYVATISGWYELAAGVSFVSAQRGFLDVVRDTILLAKADAQADGRDVGFLPIAYHFRRPSFHGKERRFEQTLTYRITGSSFKKIIADSGMWKATSDRWDEWYASVQDGPLHAYGYSRFVVSEAETPIVDLCQCVPVVPGLPADGSDADVTDDDLFPPLPPEVSWLRWRCWVEVEADSGAVAVRTLPAHKPADPDETTLPPITQEMPEAPAYPPSAFPDDPQPEPALNPAPGDIDGFNTADAGYGWQAVIGNKPGTGGGSSGGSDAGNDGKTFVQRRAVGMPVVYLCGEAIRALYPVPAPQLTKVTGKGGKELKPEPANRTDIGEGFSQGVIGNMGGPVWGAKWRLRYYLPENPEGGILPPVNPMDGQL